MSTPTPHTLPASTGTALLLPKTHTLKITNTHGFQVVDLWALNPSNPSSEYLSMSHNHAIHRKINFLTKAPTTTTTTTTTTNSTVLYSSISRPMLSWREDTSPGDHDTLISACNPLRYERMGVEGWHASCAGNYQKAVEEFLDSDAISSKTSSASTNDKEEIRDNSFPLTPPPPLNLFMNVKVDGETGGIVFRAPTSKAGDYVVLEALMDVVVVMSACPMDRRASEDWVPEPKEVHYEVREG